MPSPQSFIGRLCIGLFLGGAFCPIAGLAQVPAASPNPTEPGETAPPPTAPEAIAPPPSAQPGATQPVTPFGAAPGTFPGLAPAPSAATPGKATTPFGAAPGTFPGLAPAPSTATPGAAATPFGTAPGTFPGLSPVPSSGAPSQPGAPTGLPPGTYPGSAPAPTATSSAPTNPFPDTSLVPSAFAPPTLNPGYGFGTPAAPTPGTIPFVPLEPPPPPRFTGLPPVTPGALPVQTGNLRAPPILIDSRIYLSEGYTDNPRNTSRTFSDSITTIVPSTNISFDSYRLQGQISSSTNYLHYARASDQSSLNENLLGFGLATVVPDHFFVDGRAAITQVSTVGGVGFANSTLIPPNQQTQALVTSLSPIWRESFGNLIDTELRYNYALSVFNNGSFLRNLVSTAAPPPGAGSLSNTAENDITLTIATGRAFNALSSKLTLDATKVDTQSATRSTQLRGYDDLEYAINSTFAALARVGFEDIRYPLQPAADSVGPVWLIGGRANPYPGDYLVLRYGRQSGIYGFSGSFRYQITANTSVLASLQNGLSSSQQGIVDNLNTSQLDANGTIVNQYTGLPSALSNPEFAYASNSIYRTKNGNVSVQTVIDRDTFRVLGFFSQQFLQGALLPSTVSPAAGTDTALGANFSWSRSITPRLTSSVSLGYARETAGHQNTLTADCSLNYTFSSTLTGIVHYQFINVDSPRTVTFNNSYRRNLIEVGVTKSF